MQKQIEGNVAKGNFIELNGKRYDAITGVLVGDSTAIAPGVKHPIAPQPHPQPLHSNGRSVDGFIRPAAVPRVIQPNKPPAALHPKKPLPPKPLAAHAVRPAPAKPLPAHKPERPKTLMRRAVRKPAAQLKPEIKPQSPVGVMAVPASSLARKVHVGQIEQSRLSRAHHVPKSRTVTHFSKTLTQPVRATSTVAVPVSRPALPPPQPRSLVAPTPRSTQPTSGDIFEKAIAHATAHQQKLVPVKHHKRHRWLNLVSGMAALLIVSGFAAYVNRVNIAVHVASWNAGFSAHVPTYHPVGYAVQGTAHESHGIISISFRSGSGNYTLSQQQSNWDSRTLGDSIALAGESYHTLESNGRTIYINKDGEATWVSGGVQYRLTGNAGLGSDEISSIAASI